MEKKREVNPVYKMTPAQIQAQAMSFHKVGLKVSIFDRLKNDADALLAEEKLVKQELHNQKTYNKRLIRRAEQLGLKRFEAAKVIKHLMEIGQ